MIRPDALPVRLARSHAVLRPAEVRALFGDGVGLRGTERVFVFRSERREVSVPVEPGDAFRLVLDALDRHALGDGLPLRLRGPSGSAEAPPVEAVRRVLALPAGLVRVWGLEAGQRTTVQAGAVAFGDVAVEEGDGHVRLDRADALAAGLADGDAVRWARGLTLSLPTSGAASPASNVRPTGRLITENDVRQARLHGQTIVVGEEQIVTPAARTLGREFGVLVGD